MSKRYNNSEGLGVGSRKKMSELIALRTKILDIYEADIKPYNDVCIINAIENKKQGLQYGKEELNFMKDLKALSESVVDPLGAIYNRNNSDKIIMSRRADKIDAKRINDMSIYFIEQVQSDESNNKSLEEIQQMPEIQILNKISDYKDITRGEQIEHLR
ncbi:MAG: hypothetical protein COV35_06665 [Alphaproteobacteria bacterium CG11_big_fil_rev_8_21_14_0_20_39_49]|nr:MAG: hypothetical protein COV35_06665 [Alphaproteobacteria bacterium CG11_big_fil_rev_8_21_14_0_20_39_49]